MKTMQEAAQSALDVQSATNLSGVVHRFSEVVTILRQQHDCAGTDWVNRHPVSVLFATQIGSLTRVAIIADDACNYSKALAECEKLAKEETSLARIRELERIDRMYDEGDRQRQARYASPRE